MGFSKKIKYYLVHSLAYTNKQAQQLIDNGLVEIAGKKIFNNCILDEIQEIKVAGKQVKAGKDFIYLKFYKPTGFQSSLNPAVENNLAAFFMNYKDLSIAGRLDKMSEGLLLLSDDGKWVEILCNPEFEKEKEYLVTLDKAPGDSFIYEFENGLKIGDYTTKPCKCELAGGKKVNIILKEGKNRQIRRMCAVLGYRVTALKRLRIDNKGLDSLNPGEYVVFDNI